MRRPAAVLAVLALAVSAGCAGSTNSADQSGGGNGGGNGSAASPGSVDGFTTPVTQVPFEAGGADGSGADGSERPQARGGVGGGADTDEPGDRPGADREIKPPRGGDPDADG
jgi:hypothetical protein